MKNEERRRKETDSKKCISRFLEYFTSREARQEWKEKKKRLRNGTIINQWYKKHETFLSLDSSFSGGDSSRQRGMTCGQRV